MEAFMKEFFKTASPPLIAIIILGYFLKAFLDKRLQGIAGRVEEIGKTSLGVKKDMRGEEREGLVNLRVAIEKWEDSLQTGIFDYSMETSTKADVAILYKNDKTLFLDVKVAVVKASTYLRRPELEQQLMSAILKIRATYYPLINFAMPRLIDLQSQLMAYDLKLEAFKASEFKDMSVAPTEKDRAERLQLDSTMTAEVANFAERLQKDYVSIATQMCDLKDSINVYIYRPIKETAIDRD
jgi:hypothetical protein